MTATLRLLFIWLCLTALGGCFGAKHRSDQKHDFAKGGRIFDAHCARCHLDGDSDAPQLDEAGDWDVRTPRWSSILNDHAQNGFLGMPAKGGHSALSNQDVSDALYFMEVKIQAQQ